MCLDCNRLTPLVNLISYTHDNTINRHIPVMTSSSRRCLNYMDISLYYLKIRCPRDEPELRL